MNKEEIFMNFDENGNPILEGQQTLPIDQQQQNQPPAQQPQGMPQQTVQQQPAFDVNSMMQQLSESINSSIDSRLGAFEERINQPKGMTPEQREEMNFKIREEFENDPMGFMERIRTEAQNNAVEALKQEYAPMFEQTQQLNNRLSWKERLGNFIGEHPEAQAYLSQINMILQENPVLIGSEDPLMTAYQMATARNLMGDSGDILSNILGNEQYKSQILQNPDIKQAIINEYQQQLNGGRGMSSTNLPPMMGNNQSGTSIPASGGEAPRNLKEAKQAALRRLTAMNNPQGF